jgi:hypothetical protein
MACRGYDDAASASSAQARVGSPAEPEKTADAATNHADKVSGADAGDCSFVDVALVNQVFGGERGFVPQANASPSLRAEGAVMCPFGDDAGKRAVTVVRHADAPHQFEAYAAEIEQDEGAANPYAEDLDGIGDRAIGSAVEDINSQIAFEVGSDYTLVVCISGARDANLYAHCKEFAAKLAGR